MKPSVLKQGLAQELQTRFGAPLLLGSPTATCS